MKKYGKYYRAGLSLNDQEYEQFIKSGMGIKKIFKAMLDALVPIEKIPTEKVKLKEEEV